MQITTTDFLTVDRRSVNFCCRFVVGKIKGVLKETKGDLSSYPGQDLNL